ncbi:MAG: hypothetical protein ABSE18_04070 [Minisyncoccia bacterium]|jgi:hypothetical protein
MYGKKQRRAVGERAFLPLLRRESDETKMDTNTRKELDELATDARRLGGRL